MSEDAIYLPDFQSAKERTDYLKEHAQYFTITFRGIKRDPYIYSTFEKARVNAIILAEIINRPILIYAVLGPYDSWVENIYPPKAK